MGRLARAINAMLAQIESAFGARAASEASARRSDVLVRFVPDFAGPAGQVTIDFNVVTPELGGILDLARGAGSENPPPDP